MDELVKMVDPVFEYIRHETDGGVMRMLFEEYDRRAMAYPS